MFVEPAIAASGALGCETVAGTQWLFVATFANGGSTALAKLLASSARAELLHEHGEGQWLVPDLVEDGQAYDDTAVDWSGLRATWLAELADRPRPCVVVEKSPPNLIRLRDLLALFADMPTAVLRLTRDPFAVCASWNARYTPDHLAREWGAPTAELAKGSGAWFEALGTLYGARAAAMAALGDVTDLTLSYEALAADPAAALAPLLRRLPLLADVDPGAVVVVKDYPPARLHDMNAAQIATLTPADRAAIARGLAPYADAVAAIGYEVAA